MAGKRRVTLGEVWTKLCELARDVQSIKKSLRTPKNIGPAPVSPDPLERASVGLMQSAAMTPPRGYHAGGCPFMHIRGAKCACRSELPN